MGFTGFIGIARARGVFPVLLVLLLSEAAAGCGAPSTAGPIELHWYVFREPSGAFAQAAERCTAASGGRYAVRIVPLPADADRQRESLARRLAAKDRAIDLAGMDVIWTAEFAQAGWIRKWEGARASSITSGRLPIAVSSVSYRKAVWAAPFTSNVQLLWYRADRVARPPATWDAMIDAAERLGPDGRIEAQGERYEGLTVFFNSLLASAGGAVLTGDGTKAALPVGPTRRALAVLRRLARSPAADPALATSREDQARLAFESGKASFMLNYTYVWPAAARDAPEIAAHMRWARWPSVVPGRPSRVTVGGLNVGVSAFTRHPDEAYQAAACLVSEDNQRLAAIRGGLLPTSASLYDDPEIRAAFPFLDTVRATLADAVERPKTPLYLDVSLAISHTLHPLRSVDPDADVARLRSAVDRALRSRGLF